MSKFKSLLSDYLLPSIIGRGWGWVCHSFALIREDKLFSAIVTIGMVVPTFLAMYKRPVEALHHE